MAIFPRYSKDTKKQRRKAFTYCFPLFSFYIFHRSRSIPLRLLWLLVDFKILPSIIYFVGTRRAVSDWEEENIMILKMPFGTLSDGTPVTLYRLLGKGESHVDILDYGATVQAIRVPDQNGVLTDVVLGYDDVQQYETRDLYFGATVGRHANRIGGGKFTLNGITYDLEVNNGPNHLHGGTKGYHQRMFRAEIQGDTLSLSLTSPDMDQGYPGRLELTVSFRFDEENRFSIHYQAKSDKDTVINLTNHSYFDLSSGSDPMGQVLQLDADQFTENDENTLPTGTILDVGGTPFDFREGKPLGRDIDEDHTQLKNCNGYDHNFVLKGTGLRSFARLHSPATGITMTAATDMPGVQLYSANFVEDPKGKGGKAYHPRSAVCLETQFFPNGMAIDHFQKPILRAGDRWDHVTTYTFS